jgi:hypothetical protein
VAGADEAGDFYDASVYDHRDGDGPEGLGGSVAARAPGLIAASE